MIQIKVLNRNEIMNILSLEDVIEGVTQAYMWKAEGSTATFPLICHVFEDKDGDMDIKSGYLKDAGIYGLKTVSFFEPNTKKKESAAECFDGII